MDTIEVGFKDKKLVSKLNRDLYLAAEEVMEGHDKKGHCWHIGWADVGAFIDWLEDNYDIKKKEEVK